MAPTHPILPLDLWRQEIGYNPWHFWGLADNNVAPVTSKGAGVVSEYSWQNADAAGREDLRAAILSAESIIFSNIHYWSAPVYSETVLPWPRLSDQRLMRTGRQDVRGGWVPITLEEGWVQNCGVETYALIHAGTALVYTDEDGDGLKETFTITQATSVTDPDEIAVYFAAADRLDEDDALSPRWRIEPVRVTISAGIATIKGKRWLVVRPVLYQVKSSSIDPAIDANFITTCDVYHHYTATTGLDATQDSQSALIWESRPCNWCNNVANSSDPASEGWLAGRCGIRDSYNGIVVPAEAVYNPTTLTWAYPGDCFSGCGEPDRVLIRYLAGYPLANGWMDKQFRTLTARLAAAELQRAICGAEVSNRSLAYWQFDVSRVNNTEEYQISLESLNNPLGTRRGHIYAWQQMIGLARTVGLLA